MIDFTDYIYGNLDNTKHVLVVFIDYSKAFDTLNHDVLIDKLDDCGIRGPLLDWCIDYLKRRSYHVKINDNLGEKMEVTEGTAQGSVLGPLHYLTYVNDLPNLIKQCELFQFADDTCLVAADSNIQKAFQLLQSEFTTLIKWSHDLGLVLNADKTKMMLSVQAKTDLYYSWSNYCP